MTVDNKIGNVYYNNIIHCVVLQAYGTEAGVGEGLAALIEGGVKRPDGETVSREDLFLESKVKDPIVSITTYHSYKIISLCEVEYLFQFVRLCHVYFYLEIKNKFENP